MTRPHLLLAVVGTATEIGKTWVSCALLKHLRAGGSRVAARKPVQSFAPGDGATDAELLAAATGEHLAAVCPAHRRLPVPMAPPMAVEVMAAAPFTAAELRAEMGFPAGVDVGLVETVGGVRSPMTVDVDSATFAELVQPDAIVLVADAGLGTINAVRLSVEVFNAATPVIVFLNRFDVRDDLHRRNRVWLSERDGLRVVTNVAELCVAVG